MNILSNTYPYPIELIAPNIERFRAGNSGIEFVYRFSSQCDGPRVWVNALTHGNEISGAIAIVELLDSLRSGASQVRAGELIISFANVRAFQQFDARNPDASRYIDRDMNRVWCDSLLCSSDRSHEVQRAKQLQSLADETDYLLDLHSMHDPGPPLLLCGLTAKAAAFAQQMGNPHNIIADAGHTEGKRLIDYGKFVDENAAPIAVLLEAGHHTASDSLLHTKDCIAFYRALGCAMACCWLIGAYLMDRSNDLLK
jgi:hypothetical protein